MIFTMINSSTFPQKYDSKEKEAQILKFWEDNKIYAFNEKTTKPIFSIDTPPPTMSGKMHAGHAFSYTQTDFIARYKRMRGFEVFYPFGTDDNGLPTENLVQKKKKVDLRRVSREEAFEITNSYLQENRAEFIQDWKTLGISADFENLAYSTIDPESRKISQKSFMELHKKGLIEQREGPVLWDRKFQTAIAQAELEDIEREAFLNYVKAKVVGTENTYIIYATTRPELCFGVVGASVQDIGEYVKLKVKHNNNEEFWITGSETVEDKFKDFDYEIIEKIKGENIIGQKVMIPVVDREITISHDVAVQANFGTGIAYFCTYGGLEDKEWVSRHGVEPISVLNVYGKLNDLAGKYSGMLAENARKEIIQDMEDSGSLIRKEKKKQIVNVGERSGVEVEYIVTKQWYAKYLDKKEHFFEQAQKFNWNPEFMKHRLENWIEGLNWDWGFSRQRHFGIPIPVWICDKCQKIELPEESQLPVDPTRDFPLRGEFCECGGKFTGESDVLDTWFTSASSTHLALRNIKEDNLRATMFPMDLRPQAHDIINFWLFYSLAKSNLLDGINPFKNVAVSGWLLDPQGKKMSKSKGNGIEPQDVTAKFSNDALRFMAGSSKLGSDLPYQEKEVKTGAGVANKIFNATKFTDMLTSAKTKSELEVGDVNKLRSIDKWILAKTQGAIVRATDAFENYDYAKAKAEMEGFFMRDIADNYIEIVKQRLWKPEERGEDEKKKAEISLYHSMYSAVRGLSPFMPFVCEEVFGHYFSKFETEKSIHQTSWPICEKIFQNNEFELLGDGFISLVGAVRKFKSEKQVSQKVEIEKFVIECSKEMRDFIEDSIDDLKAVTSSRIIEFGNGTIETGTTDLKISLTLVEQ
jgi:valyl-tRNA synthetase